MKTEKTKHTEPQGPPQAANDNRRIDRAYTVIAKAFNDGRIGSRLDTALIAAKAGFAIKPANGSGFIAEPGTTNKRQITEWWTEHPHALIAIDTGAPETFHVIDAARVKEKAAELSAKKQATEQKTALPIVTEDALATDFVETHGENFRYCGKFGAWYSWDKTHWLPDEDGKTLLTMRGVANARNVGAFDKTLGKASTAKGALSFAATDRRIIIKPDDFDADPFLLGTPGGVVDLRTGELRPANRRDYITQQTLVAPSDKTTWQDDCVEWLAFLQAATLNDYEYMRYLQQIAGYCLTGDTREENILFFWGDGGNGKGTFINTFSKVMNDYAKAVPMSFFVEKQFDGHPTTLARLHNARLITASETREGRTWDEAIIKQITGGDPIPARFMGKDEFEYIPKFKPLFFGNRKPKLRSVDEGIKRRFVLAPFTNKPINPDKELKARLANEKVLQGILRWAIEGCLDWQENGLIIPDVVKEQTQVYFDTENRRGQWLEDCCELDPVGWTLTSALWHSWKTYADKYGENAGTEKSFSMWLIDDAGKNFEREKRFAGRGISGIKLIDGTDSYTSEQWQDKY